MRLSWPMPAADVVDVGPHAFANPRHLVDETDLRRKHRVGHVLRHLGALGRHRQQRLVGPQVRLIQIGQHVDHLLSPRADHHPVGLHEVVDRHALLEKLGIAGHVDVAAGQLLQPRGQLRRWFPPARCSCRRRCSPAARCGAICSTTAQSAERSTEPSAAGGVPTAEKQQPRLLRPPTARSVVNRSRPSATFRATISARPGS